jgi:hypothetical protein
MKSSGRLTGRRRLPAISLFPVATAVLVATFAVAPGASAAKRTLAARPSVVPHVETPTPVALDAYGNGSAPLVAYDPVSQVTFVAWNAPNDGGIDICVLPAHASACEGAGGASTGGPVALTDDNDGLTTGTAGAPVIGGLTVLPNGDTVVIGATAQNGATGGTLAWESPADGSAFVASGGGQQHSGSPISPVSLFYPGNNAVALSNTDVALLGGLDDDFFSDSPFAGPETPAYSSSPTPNANATGGVESNTFNRKSLWASGPEIAAEPAPAPAPSGTDIVVAAADNYADSTYTPTGCSNYAATGYGVDVGKVGGTGTGTLNHSGIPSFGTLACSAEAPALASPDGGTQGIGVLEEEGNGVSGFGSDWTVDWRPFVINSNATGGSFGSPVELQDITSVSLDGAEDFDASEDSTDGVYASWADEQGVVVDYSADGGAEWGPPVALPEPSTGSYGNPVITAIGGGDFLLAYDNNTGPGEQTFAEAFSYQALEQAPTTLTTTQTSGLTAGSNITITAGTIGESDKATLSGTNAATATGTVDFALYDNSSCSGTPTFSGAATATDGVASIADGTTPGLVPGKYYWKAAYAGDASNAASAGNCGSEVLTVAPVGVIGGGTTNGTTVTLTITCSAACTVTVTIEVPASTPASTSDKSKGPIKLATGTFKLKGRKGGREKLKLRWNKYALKLVKKHHDKFTGLLVLKSKVGKSRYTTTTSLKVRK